MKKLLFAVFFALTGILDMSAQVPAPDTSQLVQLEFGRRSKECGGFGICVFRVHINEETAPVLIKLVAAFLRTETPSTPSNKGALAVTFPAEFVKANSTFFTNSQIRIDEDLVLDKATTRALGAPDNFTIKKGIYKVTLNTKTNTYNCTF